MKPEIGIGELFRAWDALGAKNDATREAIRDLLVPSFTWVSKSPKPVPKTDIIQPPEVPRPPRIIDRSETGKVEFPVPFKAVDLPFTVTPIEPEERRLEIPAGGAQLPPDALREIDPEPLLEAVWTRRVIGGLIATEAPLGGLDVDQLLRSLTAMRVVRRLPRKRRPTMRHGVQVLLDRHPSMMVFYADQSALRREIEAFAGRERTAVLRCDGFPPARVSEISSARWRPYSPPEAGTPVLLVSDLGLVRDALPGPEALDDFVGPLRALRSDVVALVPESPESYPGYVHDRVHLLEWDAGTRPSDARRARRARR
ncbi:MAG: hypothetical protein L6R30_23660 [Thermoanaerobaculia bacterium]|nr:hypothetical protein [Thermoanaerobaculia bacterium]